ncbi:hypothetical protein ABPG75_011212 [Micractinium tetrahymenae]
MAGLAVGAVVVGRTERAQRVSRWLMDGTQPARRFLPSLPSLPNLPNLHLLRVAGAKGAAEVPAAEPAEPEEHSDTETAEPAVGDLMSRASEVLLDSDSEVEVDTPTAEAAQAADEQWVHMIKAPDAGERPASPGAPHTPGREAEAVLPGASAALSQGSEDEEQGKEEGLLAARGADEALLAARAAEQAAASGAADVEMAVDKILLSTVVEGVEEAEEREAEAAADVPAQARAAPAALPAQPAAAPFAMDASPEAEAAETGAQPLASALEQPAEDELIYSAPAYAESELEAAPSEATAAEAEQPAADGSSAKKKKGKKKGRGPLRGPMHKLAKEVRRALIAMPN